MISIQYSDDPKLQKFQKFVVWTIAGLFGAVAFGLLFGILIRFLWNATLAEMFGIPTISFWQSSFSVSVPVAPVGNVKSEANLMNLPSNPRMCRHWLTMKRSRSTGRTREKHRMKLFEKETLSLSQKNHEL